MNVSDKDEGIFQCQIQRTMNALEARSERVQLTVIGKNDIWWFIAIIIVIINFVFCFHKWLAPPMDKPILSLPNMPLRQGQSTNITCFSSPSKPASKLSLFKNEQIIDDKLSSSIVIYELDKNTKRNVTKLIYTVTDPDSSWNNAIIRCKQIYELTNKSYLDVTATIQTHCKWINKRLIFSWI